MTFDDTLGVFIQRTVVPQVVYTTIVLVSTLSSVSTNIPPYADLRKGISNKLIHPPPLPYHDGIIQIVVQEPALQSLLVYACHQQPTENLLTSSTHRDGVGVLLIILIRMRSRMCTQLQGGEAPHDGVRSLLLILIITMEEAAYSRGRG